MTTPTATVYIVEDDLDVCDSLEAIVTALGYTCCTFDTAEALLIHWDEATCDCLVIDVDLPDLSGIELLSRLHQAGSKPQAVFYTGRSDSRLRNAAASLENTPILKKGKDTREFTEYLRRSLSPSP